MILEIAFPHCIVRSFHYARVSLPTTGAGATEPYNGLCTLGGHFPRVWVPPSLQWAALGVPVWPAVVGPHTACPCPSQHCSPAAQVRGHFVGRIVFIRQSCVSCPVAEAAFPGSSCEFSPQRVGIRKFQILKKIVTTTNYHHDSSTL